MGVHVYWSEDRKMYAIEVGKKTIYLSGEELVRLMNKLAYLDLSKIERV